MKYDLKTKEGREEAIKSLEKSFLDSLRKNNIEISEDAAAVINEESIILGLKDNNINLVYGTEVYIYSLRKKDGIENKILPVSSSAFNPENNNAYWRIIHAASILKNWRIVCDIVNIHCQMFIDLKRKIMKLN